MEGHNDTPLMSIYFHDMNNKIVFVRKSAMYIQNFIFLILYTNVLGRGVLYNSKLRVHPNVKIFGQVEINIFGRSCRRYASSIRGNSTLVSVYRHGVNIYPSTNS